MWDCFRESDLPVEDCLRGAGLARTERVEVGEEGEVAHGERHVAQHCRAGALKEKGVRYQGGAKMGRKVTSKKYQKLAQLVHYPISYLTRYFWVSDFCLI